MNQKQIQQMMKQAQKLQSQMEEAQANLSKKEYSYSAGGGVVQLVVYGSKQIKSIEINDEILDPEEKDLLQELLVNGLNQVYADIDKEAETTMGQYTQGLPF